MARSRRYSYSPSRPAYKPRSVRHLEKNSKKKLYSSIIIIAVVSYVFFFWVIPTLIGHLSVVNKNKTSDSSPAEYVELAPPVFNIPYEATNTATIKVSGYTQPKDKVQIYINDSLRDTINAQDDGTFTSNDLGLSVGSNSLYGKSINEKNQISLASKTITIVYSNDKPTLDVSDPQDNKTIQGGDKKVTVKGKTDSNNSVTVNGQVVILSPDGSFSKDIDLNDGDNQIIVVATNSVGNTTTVTKKVTYNH